MIPFFSSKEDLNKQPELREKVETGLANNLSGVEEMELDGKPGYSWKRFDDCLVHYRKTSRNYYHCLQEEYKKEGREPTCCAKEGPPKSRQGTVIIKYETDSNGNVIRIPDNFALELEPGYLLNFKNSVMTVSLPSVRVQTWKTYFQSSPHADFLFWMEDNKFKVEPCEGNHAIWRQRGSAFQERIIKEAMPCWERFPDALGTTFSIAQIDTSYGLGN